VGIKVRVVTGEIMKRERWGSNEKREREREREREICLINSTIQLSIYFIIDN
jgi:hypothetical protein